MRRAALDGAAWTAAILVAVLLRYDFQFSRLDAPDMAAVLIPTAIAAQWVLGYLAGLYRGRWRSGSFDELPVLARTVAEVTVLVVIIDLATEWQRPIPLSAAVAAGFVAFVFMGGARSLWRLNANRRLRPADHGRTPVVVFGAGDGGARAVEAMLHDPESPFVPVGLLDDDPEKQGLSIGGVRVVGDREAVGATAERYGAAALLIAVPTADSGLIRDLARRADNAGLDVRILPSVRELLDGEIRIVDIRQPNEVDLLGRNVAAIDLTVASECLRGRVVAVTGAGGSIGSELSRQISACGPSALIMIDRDESALHAVQMSIDGRGLLDSDSLALLDIRDRDAVARLFKARRPDVVFHAAALKHLPLLEAHPMEALKTNVWGTRAVLDAAAAVDIERFVNISTDKAANPCSVLGYSKRICEGLTAYSAALTGRPYLSVRFGNVLQSRGSVLTAFREQIQAGGPITVTDPDVARFFMTVEEAVELVLQGAAIGRGGQTLVLEMGEPVRIADVARRLATTSSPPVRIEFTGLRPGEKMCEQLFSDEETSSPTEHPLINSVEVPPLAPDHVCDIDPTQNRETISKLLRILTEDMAAQTGNLSLAIRG